MNTRYETRSVLAGAYKRMSSTLTHTYDTITDSVMCTRVAADALADPYAGDIAAAPTCKTCALRDPRGHAK